MADLEAELTCPVCKSLVRDPFVSACGHTFCYACVSQHLGQRKSCPSCNAYLTFDLVFPNFALQRLAAGALSAQRRQRISLAEQVPSCKQPGALKAPALAASCVHTSTRPQPSDMHGRADDLLQEI